MANNLAKSHLALTPNLSDLPPPSPEIVSVVALYLPELCWEDSAGWETWNTKARIIHVLYILEKPFPLELRFLKQWSKTESRSWELVSAGQIPTRTHFLRFTGSGRLITPPAGSAFSRLPYCS